MYFFRQTRKRQTCGWFDAHTVRTQFSPYIISIFLKKISPSYQVGVLHDLPYLTEIFFHSLNPWESVIPFLHFYCSHFLGWFALPFWGPGTSWYHCSGKSSGFPDTISLLKVRLVIALSLMSLSSPLRIAAETQAFGEGPLSWPVFFGVVWPGGAQQALWPRLSPVPRCHFHSGLCSAESKEKVLMGLINSIYSVFNWTSVYNNTCLFHCSLERMCMVSMATVLW